MSKSKLGAAVLVALAAMAVGAGAAQAATFEAAEYPAFVSGEQASPGATDFGFESGQIADCEIAGLAGVITEATSALEVSSGFNECDAFGAAATIETSECSVVLHPGSGSGDKFTGTFDFACPTGNKITISGNTCEVEIGSQTGLGPVTYEIVTAATPDEVEAKFEMKAAAGFAYTKAKDGASCPLSGTGAKTDGIVTGTMKLKAGDFELNPIDFGIG